jgi:hypothetical protein
MVLFHFSLYITVEKSISLPLDSIELAVNEGDVWVQPQELSSEYVEAKEQLNKMKVRVLEEMLVQRKCIWIKDWYKCI